MPRSRQIGEQLLAPLSSEQVVHGSVFAVPTTADEIARLAGAYNLPNGQVPIIDGSPHWPWDEPVAHQRLVHVANLLDIRLTGNELLMDSGSNDAWRIGDRVIRICWRGDIGRLVRESMLAEALPVAIPHARVDDYGRDDTISWAVSPRVPGISLADLWATAPEDQLRDLTRQSADVMRALHRWSPPVDLATILRQARQPPDAGALALVGALGSPTHPDHQQTMVRYLRGTPFIDGVLLDAVSARIHAIHTAPNSLPQKDVLVHGDYTPGNTLVDNGKITAVLDFEYASFAPATDDLAMPWIWIGQQPPGIRAGRFLDWLHEDYPEPFEAPDLAVRREIADLGFALRVCIVWPPDRPESQLPPEHTLHQLRRLATTTDHNKRASTAAADGAS